jgi:nucleoid DNA-binding protein
MKRQELTKKLAREMRISQTAAQMAVDELLQSILDDLRKGRPVKLPGVGKLQGAKKQQ